MRCAAPKTGDLLQNLQLLAGYSPLDLTERTKWELRELFFVRWSRFTRDHWHRQQSGQTGGNTVRNRVKRREATVSNRAKR
jgi:hypothetical protein